MDEALTSTRALAVAIAEGARSSRDAVDGYLARIERHHDTLGAVVTVDAEAARARADAADAARARGESWGPLHGVPFTVKDTFETAGVRTTAGAPELADHVPERDATVVHALKQAGAILLGKTNTPTMAGRSQTDNPVFGRTNNPWDPTRTPGGSSGGSAAAVAAGLTPFDVGSDMSGSIRMPAHYCGVFGFKPSAGRISIAGHIPGLPGEPRVERHLGVAGPITRSAADLSLIAGCMVGADARDTEVVPMPFRRMAPVALADLRIAVAPTLPGVPVARAIRAAIEEAAAKLSAAGARVESRLPETDFAQDRVHWLGFLNAFMHGLSGLSALRFLPPQGPLPSLVDWLRLLEARDGVIRRWEAFFERWDVLLTPAVPVVAPPHSPSGTPLVIDGVEVPSSTVDHFLYWFSFTGHPASVLPVGHDEAGLPIGAQLVAARHRDEALLAATEAIDVELGGFRVPPGFG